MANITEKQLAFLHEKVLWLNSKGHRVIKRPRCICGAFYWVTTVYEDIMYEEGAFIGAAQLAQNETQILEKTRDNLITKILRKINDRGSHETK